MDARVAWVGIAVLLVGCLAGPAPAPDAPTPTPDAPAHATGTGTASVDSPDPGVGVRATVVEVVDGDTLTVEYPNGTRTTVRLIGVDTPEVHAATDPAEFGVPDTAAGRACLRRWGERASRFARRSLAGATVRLRGDPNLPQRGDYGRLLAYVAVDGRPFNRRLVAGGYARVYESDFRRRGDYRSLRDAARANRTGVWACRDPREGATATATEGTGSPVIAAVHPDAAGNDHQNPNGEYVVLENAGSTPVDLTGWTVADAAGHVYRFAGGTLAPGERITLYTGQGTDSATERYWGRSRAVWNNGGDAVVVRDDWGRTVARRSYD